MNQNKKSRVFLPIFFLIIVLAALATTATPFASAIPQMEGIITTADQYYTVFFDGEGEAIVLAKITLNNVDSGTIDELELEIPGSANVLGAVQEGTFTHCEEREYYCKPSYGYERLDTDVNELSGATYATVELEEPLKEEERTTIIVLYKAYGYADASFGATQFTFESAKLAYDTTNIRVAVDLQEGLRLKGGDSSINYYTPSFGGMADMMAASSLSEKQTSEMRSYTNQIGTRGALTKSAGYLDPHESLVVEGSYAKSWFALYWGRLTMTLLVLGVLVTGATLLIKKSVRRAKGRERRIPQTKTQEKKKEKEKVAGAKEGYRAVAPQDGSSPFLPALLGGLGAVLGSAILWTLTTLLILFADEVLRHGANELFAIIIGVLGVLLTLAILIGTPLFVSSRYGTVAGGLTVVSTFAWSFLLTLIGFVLYALFSSGPTIMH